MKNEGIEILNGMEIIGKALWLPKQKVLVLADVHIGYEESLNKQGILVPRHQFKETKKEIEVLLKKIKPRVIVINGDLKHEFGEISRQEWRETLAMLDLLLANCKKVVLVKGNHDTILEPIARIKGLEVMEYYCVDSGSTAFFHGDKIPMSKEVYKAKVFVIAHEHPSISLREGFKVERYKCFLLGSWYGKKLVVMPSFLPTIEGLDIRNEERLSHLLKQNLDDFKVFVVGDKIYNFGKLRNIS